MKITSRVVCCLLSFLVSGSPFDALAQAFAPMPKLSGVARIGDQTWVVLEVPRPSLSGTSAGQTIILHAGERQAAIEVKSISLSDASAELVCYGTNVLVRLDGTKRSIAARSYIELTNAPLTAVLELYATAAGRTILLHPLVPVTRLAVTGSVSDPAAVTPIFAQTLTNYGIVSIPDGEKFLQLIPQFFTDKVQLRSQAIESSKLGGVAENIWPVGSVNLIAANLPQVAKIYASLIGREFDRDSISAVERPFPDVVFKNQTALTTSEMIYALDVQFAWRGVKMVAGEDKTAHFVPLASKP